MHAQTKAMNLPMLTKHLLKVLSQFREVEVGLGVEIGAVHYTLGSELPRVRQANARQSSLQRIVLQTREYITILSGAAPYRPVDNIRSGKPGRKKDWIHNHGILVDAAMYESLEVEDEMKQAFTDNAVMKCLHCPHARKHLLHFFLGWEGFVHCSIRYPLVVDPVFLAKWVVLLFSKLNNFFWWIL